MGKKKYSRPENDPDLPDFHDFGGGGWDEPDTSQYDEIDNLQAQNKALQDELKELRGALENIATIHLIKTSGPMAMLLQKIARDTLTKEKESK